MAQVTVGLVQMVCNPDPQVNDRRAVDLIRQAANQGAKIVCLPELFRTPYFCQTEDYEAFALAEPIPGHTTDLLQNLAQALDIAIIASLFEKRTEGIYHNTAVVLDGRQGYLGKYRKMHIPDDPLYYEKFYFTPGDLHYQVFGSTYGRLGTLVCWDQWYPEAARLTAMRGAEILFYPTAIGWHPWEKHERGKAQHEAWEIMQRSHAIANGCFVVAVNRAGFEATPGAAGGIEFWGQSFVCAPDGQVVARAGVTEEQVLTVSLDLTTIAPQRQGWPFWRDRRIDSYQDLTRRFIDP